MTAYEKGGSYVAYVYGTPKSQKVEKLGFTVVN